MSCANPKKIPAKIKGKMRLFFHPWSERTIEISDHATVITSGIAKFAETTKAGEAAKRAEPRKL